MNKPHNSGLALEISHEKLLDFLMHAATREDISKLDDKVEKFNSKLEEKIDKLDRKFTDKFDQLDQKFTDKFDQLDQKLDRNTESLRKEFNDKLNQTTAALTQLDTKYDRLLWLIVTAILIPIILHFVK